MTGLRLLVATVGEPASRGAVLVTAALTKRDAADVLVLGIAPPVPHSLSGLLSLTTPEGTDDDRRRDVLAHIHASLDGVGAAEGWTMQVTVGPPAESIIDGARVWRASMIVIGTGRHNKLDRVFGGETAVAVMRGARIPVLAVPPGVDALPRRAVVAADFTSASAAAADLAAALVATDGAVTIAHACALADTTHREGDLVDIYRTGARAKLDDAARELRTRTGRRVDTVMLEGDPAAALLAYADREHCDVIALGGHAQGLMDRILLGSVRTQVLRGAHCSVLIVPPG